jgi:hypothetical protein
MIWKKDGSSFEIRTQGQLEDGSPALDEIVADGASIHLEQMSHDSWFMGITAGGKYFHLNFALVDGRLEVILSDQDEDEYVEWVGDSRERPLPGNEALQGKIMTDDIELITLVLPALDKSVQLSREASGRIWDAVKRGEAPSAEEYVNQMLIRALTASQVEGTPDPKAR